MKAMHKNLALIGGLGAGASLMYVFDPLVGRRRRAVARDKIARFARETSKDLEMTSRDLTHRAYGFVAETKNLIFKKEVNDAVLADRIRSELGFLVSHPSSIEVAVEKGEVKLSGVILEGELNRLLRRISAMHGVVGVENRLEAHPSGADVPGLQGKPRRARDQRLDIMQSRWAPATRLLVGTAAGAALLYSTSRRGPVGAAITLLSGGMFARALTNWELKRLIGADPKSRMDQDLMRMKSMIETGVQPHDAARKDAGESVH
jgi:hypothetical protein